MIASRYSLLCAAPLGVILDVTPRLQYDLEVKGSDTVVWTEADGCPVNLESNLIGKYAERLLQGRGQFSRLTVSIDTDYLQQAGIDLKK